MQIQSLAVQPASVETANFRSVRSKHMVNGFIVDGDYYLEKLDKRTMMITRERVWNEIIPPFEVPEDEGIAVLINPDNHSYVWIKKPELWHPCWLRYDEENLMIVDMITNAVIGRGI